MGSWQSILFTFQLHLSMDQGICRTASQLCSVQYPAPIHPQLTLDIKY